MKEMVGCRQASSLQATVNCTGEGFYCVCWELEKWITLTLNLTELKLSLNRETKEK